MSLSALEKNSTINFSLFILHVETNMASQLKLCVIDWNLIAVINNCSLFLFQIIYV